MAYKDMREFIEALEGIGELRCVNGADWDLEIGGLAELMARPDNSRALLFDEIKGYPKGYRILCNSLNSVRRTALALGMPLETSGLELLRAWRQALADFEPVAPVEVENAPVKENVIVGDDVNLYKFPAPKWHEFDPARFLGTGNMVVMKDPDSDWINVGTYRNMLHDEKTVGILTQPGKHGYLFIQKANARGETIPVAISLGHDPTLLIPCGSFSPYGVCEYDFAGYLRKKPVEITRGVITGLPIPAHSEVVIEGEIPPLSVETRDEGPFGEWTGYLGGGPSPQPVIRVKAILHRNDPILLGAPPVKPPASNFTGIPLPAADTWDALIKAGIPDVQGVWQFGGWNPMITVVSIKQRYAGHAKQAGLVACGSKGSAYCGKLVIVVDEDVDITDIGEVMWVVSTRCDPATSIDLIRECWSSNVDPILPPEERIEAPHGTQTNSRLIINACRPYSWKEKFPRVNKASPELQTRLLEKYSWLFK